MTISRAPEYSVKATLPLRKVSNLQSMHGCSFADEVIFPQAIPRVVSARSFQPADTSSLGVAVDKVVAIMMANDDYAVRTISTNICNRYYNWQIEPS